jgi:MFS family permease
MAYIPELEPSENLALQIAFKVSEKAAAFNFAVSDKALYWPATRAFAVNDATYFKRIRNGEISEVCVRRLPPYGLWVVAVLMILVGLVTAYFMYAPLINHEPGEHRVSGWPIAFLVGGILLPFAARGRLGLEVKTHDKKFRWKPPLVVDKISKKKIQAAFDEIVAACDKSGLRVARN